MPETSGARQRSARDERIATAALELLRHGGAAAVTIEAVAARSGVAKTTIYRRYRDRGEMLTAALDSVARPEPPATITDPSVVLSWVIEQSLHAVETGIGPGGIAALLVEDDSELTAAIRSVVVRHRASLARVITDAAHQGGAPTDLDVDTFIDCVAGAYLSESARGGTVREGWTHRIRTFLEPLYLGPTHHRDSR